MTSTIALALFAAMFAAQTSTSAQVEAAAASIHGRVIDARTGAPLRDVAVTGDRTRQQVASDADGRFMLTGLAAGRHALVFSLVGYALVKRTVDVTADRAADIVVPLPEGAGTYAEDVLVRGDVFGRPERGVPSQQTLGSAEIQSLRGVLADDPMRAVQVLPGVVTGDDFRSEFTVRGSDFRHIGVSIDGVPTSLLLHLMPGLEDTGSIAMINSDVLESVTLFGGSHPQRFGNHTGAQVDFRLRSGSRDRTAFRGAVSATNASVVAEGPIGRSRRGAWLVSGRQSYLQWVLRRIDPDIGSTFGFTDVQAKAVYDVSARHQLDVVAIGGVTTLSRLEDVSGINSYSDGVNRSGMLSAASRLTLGGHLLLTQRMSIVANEYRTMNRDSQRLDSGTENELSYRADVTATTSARTTLEGGVSVLRVRSDGRAYVYDTARPGRYTLDAFTGRGWTSSAYAQMRTAFGRALITPGIRLDWWQPISRTAVSPWLQVEWPVAGTWRVLSGTGVYRQPPPVEAILGPRGSAALRDEHAWHGEVGVEHEWTPHVRWRATIYDREERDILRLPGAEDRLDQAGLLVRRSATSRWAQPLSGSSRGAELLVQRSSPQGYSGWLAYSYGRSCYADGTTGEIFDADADQRHTLNLQASYRFTNRLSVGLKFRVGSNVPVAGYYRQAGDQFFVTEQRNTLRLPHYARLDLRAARTFAAGSRRLTLFVEVLNAYNRPNYGPTGVNVNRRTLEATGLIEDLLPILPSAGLLIEF